MTLQDFTIEYALRHKEMPKDDLIRNIKPFLEDELEQNHLNIYKGCFLRLKNELRISPSITLPSRFIICVTEVFYYKDKEEVAFNYRFDIYGRESAQHIGNHHFNPHPISILGTIFDIVKSSKCSALLAEVDSRSSSTKRKYCYKPDKSTLL